MNEYIKREEYLSDSRENAAKLRGRQRQRTREERLYRKRRTIYLVTIVLWALILIALLIYGKAEEAVVPEVKEEPTPVVAIQTVQAIPAISKEEAEIKPEPLSAEIVEKEAVPMEFDPVREDIPMDADTQRLLFKACGETGIVYELALAVIWQETDFRNVTGDGGDSFGYMQVQPRWHKERMERLGVTDLMDPYSNFLVGCDFLAELFGKYDTAEALTAYNSGRSGNSQYAKDVLNYMNILITEEM